MKELGEHIDTLEDVIEIQATCSNWENYGMLTIWNSKGCVDFDMYPSKDVEIQCMQWKMKKHNHLEKYDCVAWSFESVQYPGKYLYMDKTEEWLEIRAQEGHESDQFLWAI